MSHKLQITETFPYKAQDLMDIVMDAEGYKEMSQYLDRIDVTDKGENVKGVNAVIKTPFFSMHYGCDLQLCPPNVIKAAATKSPFKEFYGELTFNTLSDGTTQVDCNLNYATGINPIAIMAAANMESLIKMGVNAARDYLAENLEAVDTNVQQTPVSKGPSGFDPAP